MVRIIIKIHVFLMVFLVYLFGQTATINVLSNNSYIQELEEIVKDIIIEFSWGILQ